MSIIIYISYINALIRSKNIIIVYKRAFRNGKMQLKERKQQLTKYSCDVLIAYVLDHLAPDDFVDVYRDSRRLFHPLMACLAPIRWTPCANSWRNMSSPLYPSLLMKSKVQKHIIIDSI